MEDKTFSLMPLIVLPDGKLYETLEPIPNTFEEILPLILYMGEDGEGFKICIDVTKHAVDPNSRPYFFAWLDWETAVLDWGRVKTIYERNPQTLTAIFKCKEWYDIVLEMWNRYRNVHIIKD